MHQTINTESNILPVSISHVFRSDCLDKNCGYGKGFKLNLQQTLTRIDISGDENARWEYIDAIVLTLSILYEARQ